MGQKIIRINYEITHKKILKAVSEIKRDGTEPTIANVCERAGVSQATAYKHGARQMLLEMIWKGCEAYEQEE